MNKKHVLACVLCMLSAAVYAADVNLSFGFTFNAWDSAVEGPSSHTHTGYALDNCENFIRLTANGLKSGIQTRLWYGKNANLELGGWMAKTETWLENGYGGEYGEGAAVLYIMDIMAWVRPVENVRIDVGNNLEYAVFKETINWNPIGNRMTGSLGTLIEYSPLAFPGLTVVLGQMFNDMGSLGQAYVSNANTEQDFSALGQSGFAAHYIWGDFLFGLCATMNDFDGGAVGWTNSWENWSVGAGVQYTGDITVIAGASAEMLDNQFYMVQGGLFLSMAAGPVTLKVYDLPVYQPDTVPSGVTFANISKIQATYPLTPTVSLDVQVKHAYNYNAFTPFDFDNPGSVGNGYNNWGKAFATEDGAHDIFFGTSLGFTWGECLFRPGFYVNYDIADEANEWYIPLSFNFNL